MLTLSPPILAGVASTVIFAISTLPMLVRAYRTRDMSSYSLGNMAWCLLAEQHGTWCWRITR
jgi:hypothetical protein